jgi:hypothetical protein
VPWHMTGHMTGSLRGIGHTDCRKILHASPSRATSLEAWASLDSMQFPVALHRMPRCCDDTRTMPRAGRKPQTRGPHPPACLSHLSPSSGGRKPWLASLGLLHSIRSSRAGARATGRHRWRDTRGCCLQDWPNLEHKNCPHWRATAHLSGRTHLQNWGAFSLSRSQANMMLAELSTPTRGPHYAVSRIHACACRGR